MKNAYGIDVYFGTIGEKNGRAINYAVTLDENTIVIDEKQASNLSEQALLNEVVKEELIKPGRDIRDDLPTPVLKSKLLDNFCGDDVYSLKNDIKIFRKKIIRFKMIKAATVSFHYSSHFYFQRSAELICLQSKMFLNQA